MSDLVKAHTVISYYQTKYKQKYGRSAIVNRNKLQYLIANMLKDLSLKELKQLIDFYLETDKNPQLYILCYEYDQVLERMQQEAADLDMRKILLSETQKKVEEFRRRYGAS